MSYDPYQTDPYQDDEFLFDLYGSPQYTQGAGMPGDTFSKKASALKSMIALSGLPLPQLLAGGYTQDQAEIPVNQTAQMYGNNPMYQAAFDAIDQGGDPQTVFANLTSPENAAKYGFNPEDSNTAQRIFGTLEDYAKGQFEVNSAQANDPGRSFTLSNGKKFKGDPNVMGFASEYDLMGAPEVSDLVSQYARSKAPSKVRGGESKTGSGYSMANMPTMAPQGLSPVQKKQYELAAGHRLNQSKGNMVRSDANASAMRSLTTLRALLGM